MAVNREYIAITGEDYGTVAQMAWKDMKKSTKDASANEIQEAVKTSQSVARCLGVDGAAVEALTGVEQAYANAWLKFAQDKGGFLSKLLLSDGSYGPVILVETEIVEEKAEEVVEAPKGKKK